MEGVCVSSYCPCFTDQRKAIKKTAATNRLQQIKTMMAVISWQSYFRVEALMLIRVRLGYDFYQLNLICLAFHFVAIVVITITLMELNGMRTAATRGESKPCTA